MELELPHHLIMFRGQPYSHLPGLAGKTVVRTLLIPRKPAFGERARETVAVFSLH